MAIKTLKADTLKWVHIDQVDDAALDFLKKKYNFHHLDLDDIQGEAQTPKLDTYKNYLFLILHFPYWDQQNTQVTAEELSIFVGEGFLITIQRGQSKQMKEFFYKSMRNKKIQKDWMNATSGYLLYRLLESLFKNSRPMINNIGRTLSKIETSIFDGQQYTQMVKELAVYRRAVLTIRRIIDPQRYLIATLSHVRKPFVNEQTTLYFDDISDYLNKTWAVVDTYKDTIDGLHVTVESLINQRTNKVIGSLTTISVAMLPFTVLASIYGMNIVGLPFADNAVTIWGMFAVLAIIVTVVIWTMRSKKWL
ncbi:MAG: hypothetical protein COU35_02775 [Candidatus Magasanikbacteria bacterium CG10_big_fil_rev_8_21_14_0_10_47_10]|uniref:Magnesium transporter CorA n=1 Tax=Candidatus Magasanikbacteria bacterium CG10_big_fil_rev_8_21_14_0_10_47_10 TaxID=1974652 RepID=A0A2H0TQA9_9BACT|nr:MAG: hypothetical protein COU35_02775 [Candidatus Magasanikbacteria bacterium CG10_big_fil_rev_8_21_14_0_10_47_10]